MRLLTSSIRRNTASKFGSEVIGRLATFVMILAAARRLSVAGYGQFNYAIAAGFVLAQFADLGLQLVITRQVAADSGGPKSQRDVATALRLKIILSAVVLAAIVVLSLRAGDLRDSFSLAALALVPLLFSYLEFVGHVFRGRQNLQVEARLLAVARIASAVVGVAVLVAGTDLPGLALSQLATAALFALIALLILRNGAWRMERGGSEPGDGRHTAASLMRAALPLGASIILSTIYTRLALLLLQPALGETAVAEYSAAARLVEPSQLVPASVMAATFPVIVAAMQVNRAESLRLSRRATLLLLGLGVVFVVFAWTAGSWLLPLLFGAGYVASVPIFRVLSLSAVPAFTNFSLTHYLIARGDQFILSILMAGMLLVHAVLSTVLIGRMGVVGPAISVLVSELLLTAGCLVAIRFIPTQDRYAQQESAGQAVDWPDSR